MSVTMLCALIVAENFQLYYSDLIAESDKSKLFFSETEIEQLYLIRCRSRIIRIVVREQS